MYGIQTYDITKHYKRKDGTSIRLNNIYRNAFGKDFQTPGKKHEAMEDAAATMEIFQNLIETIQLPRHDQKGYYDEDKWTYMTLHTAGGG